MHHPGPFGAEIFKHLRQRLGPLLGEHANHLAAHAGRVGERSEQVEDRAGAELDAGRPDILHRRMMRRREHEADAGLADAVPDLLGRQVDIDAQRRQYVGGAGLRRQRAIAVLGDRHARAGDNKRRAGRNVERAGGVAAGADHVDGVRRRVDPQHLGAHRGDRAGDFIDRLAAHAQRHQKRAHLRRRRFARHHLLESGSGFLAAERGAGCDLPDQSPELYGHRAALTREPALFAPCVAAALRAVRSMRSMPRRCRESFSASDGHGPRQCFRDETARRAPATWCAPGP